MDVFLAKGTRDLLPEQMHNRLHVMGIVRDVFARFGFEPLETPAFERIETLLGKYGEEGDKLVFKILERGEGGREGKADLALRYDLTVPLARVMAMHPEIRLPFRRWQMQPVWRAERPQKGRFREFWQCDVDIVGAAGPLPDAECVAVVDTALRELGFTSYTIRMNDRRILSDLAKRAGATDTKQEMSVLIALDKLDKIGKDGVSAELERMGFAADGVAALWAALAVEGGNAVVLDHLERSLDDRGREGVATLRRVLEAAEALGVDLARVQIDPTLARGLDYYTGPVFETVVPNFSGSISGGGRYDGLIGMFSSKPMPAVGVALGLERILVVMEELGMLPKAQAAADVLVLLFDETTVIDALRVAARLRAAGVRAETFPEVAKLGKQFKHADARGYRWTILAGPDEVAKGVVALKDLREGQQHTLPLDQAIATILGTTPAVLPP